MPSESCSQEFERASMMCSKLEPPRPFASIMVSFESLGGKGGMCFESSYYSLPATYNLLATYYLLTTYY